MEGRGAPFLSPFPLYPLSPNHHHHHHHHREALPPHSPRDSRPFDFTPTSSTPASSLRPPPVTPFPSLPPGCFLYPPGLFPGMSHHPSLWSLPFSPSGLGVMDPSASSAFKSYDDVKAGASIGSARQHATSAGEEDFVFVGPDSDENRSVSAGPGGAGDGDVSVCVEGNDVRNRHYYYDKKAFVPARDVDRGCADDARSLRFACGADDAGDVVSRQETAVTPPLRKLAAHSGVFDSDGVINVCDVGTPSR